MSDDFKENPQTSEDPREKLKDLKEEDMKEIYTRMSHRAPVAAKKLIDAIGQKPENYSQVTWECVAALIFGMLGAISVDEFKCHDTYWTTTEMSFIAHLLLDTPPEESVKLAKYLLNNCNEKDNPDLNPDVWQLIHYGIDLYYIVDQPERLKKAAHAILQACYKSYGMGKSYGTGEEN